MARNRSDETSAIWSRSDESGHNSDIAEVKRMTPSGHCGGLALSLEDCPLDSIDLDQSAFEISLGISVSKPDEIDPRNDPSLRCCGGGDDLPMPYNWAEGASLVRRPRPSTRWRDL
jgi:hypothetical protein